MIERWEIRTESNVALKGLFVTAKADVPRLKRAFAEESGTDWETLLQRGFTVHHVQIEEPSHA